MKMGRTNAKQTGMPMGTLVLLEHSKVLRLRLQRPALLQSKDYRSGSLMEHRCRLEIPLETCLGKNSLSELQLVLPTFSNIPSLRLLSV
jgi:hypothetical protein